jgi:tRNA A37 threonylcarbamoyladenosine biosynthesis protein TsaE
MIGPAVPHSNFRTESYVYSMMSAVVGDFWNKRTVPELVCINFSIDSKDTSLWVYDLCRTVLAETVGATEVQGSFVEDRQFFVRAGYDFLITVKNDSYRGGSTNSIKEYHFDLYGSVDHVTKINAILEERLRNSKLVKVSWYYKGHRGIDSASLHVTGLNQTVHDEFYPWFDQGVDQFVRDYFNNSAAVLVLYGPPGTGKTSFLRHMLLSQSINAAVTYDERILKDDSFFVNYLTDEEHNALIVEDADVFLSPREDGDNDMMSKFLNVSDGLVKITNKKLIFTTNISQLNKIDSALLRPGRCFAAVEFREMYPNEARAAARVAGAPDRDWSEQPRWSLAQIFNSEEASAQQRDRKKFKVGFV